MQKIRQFCESALFSNSETSRKTKIWKWFPHLMAMGFTARLVVALTCDCHAWADEIMNYLEQAHRAVFGYGFIPWEYRFGVRSWLIPSIPALPLWLSKAAGLDSPSFYVPFVYSFNALISMAIPAGMYFFTRRAVSESAARYAFVFGLFWYELIAFAPRTLAEPYATAAFFGALALMSQKNGKKIFATSLLLGLATALRWQYAPVVGITGLAWLISMSSGRKIAIAGGILSIAIWGIIDFFTWGRLFHSVTTMLQISSVFSTLEFFASHTTPLYKGIVWLVAASLGLHFVSLIAGIANMRRLFLPVFTTLLALLVHMLPEAIEYRNIFIVIPLSMMVAGSVAGLAGNKIRTIICGTSLCVSFLGFSGKLPEMQLALGNYTRYVNTSTTPGIKAAKQLSQLPDTQVRGVLWLAGNQIFAGGYFYLHKNIPSYFMADPQNRRLVQDALSSGTKLSEVASHIVSPGAVKLAGFKPLMKVPEWSGWIIYENKNIKTVKLLAGLYYDTFDPNWMNIGERAKEAGMKINSLPLTPYKKR